VDTADTVAGMVVDMVADTVVVMVVDTVADMAVATVEVVAAAVEAEEVDAAADADDRPTLSVPNKLPQRYECVCATLTTIYNDLPLPSYQTKNITIRALPTKPLAVTASNITFRTRYTKFPRT